MALPSRIELCGGADRHLRLGLRLIWASALINLLLHAQRMPLVLLLVSAVLLLWSWPKNSMANMQQRRLVLQASGLAQWGDEAGEWQRNTWRSPWYTAIRFKSDRHCSWLWISARDNDADAYRQLGVWCRFSPQQPATTANDSH